MKTKLKDLRRKRAELLTKMRAIVAKEADLPDDQQLEKEDTDQIEALTSQIQAIDARISRVESVLAVEAVGATSADPDAGADPDDEKDGEDDEDEQKGRVASHGTPRTHLRSAGTRGERAPEKGLVIGGMVKMIALSHGIPAVARVESKTVYGERHPVTKALNVSQATAGGLAVPPDYVAELIELLRASTVIRDAGPRMVAMPRGTMTMPRQSQAASAGYGSELARIPVSQQAVDQIVATYKKLTALVPVTNDLLRYSDPSFDAIVRDDLVEVFALREDAAFIRGDGSQESPRGLLSFALPSQFVTSTAGYTFATAAAELGGLMNKIEQANVKWKNPCWIMSPRSKNYLLNVQNAVGAYIYKDEMKMGTLLGVPYKTTTQIPNNLVVNGATDCSEVYLAEMSQMMLFDSMSMELSISREGTYTDSNGNQVSAFQQDQTLVRGIAEHDFQARHPEAIAVLQGVRWAPAIQ